MALKREQIEHFEHLWEELSKKDKNENAWWRELSHSRKWMKKQTNKFIRLQNKKIDDDDIGGKRGRKPLCGWEY